VQHKVLTLDKIKLVQAQLYGMDNNVLYVQQIVLAQQQVHVVLFNVLKDMQHKMVVVFNALMDVVHVNHP
jgi:hypothetical protein